MLFGGAFGFQGSGCFFRALGELGAPLVWRPWGVQTSGLLGLRVLGSRDSFFFFVKGLGFRVF